MSTLPSAGPTCERFQFRGRVQGVGFRQYTRNIARLFPVVGFVRNLGDGSVELIAKGPTSALTGLLQRILSDFGDSITSHTREPWTLDEEMTALEIRY